MPKFITETDFFCHQLVEPHAYVPSNERSWADRGYHTVSDPDRFGIDFGVSMYPNNDHLETYAIAALPGRQWSLRACRELSDDRWNLNAGPITFKIVEPLKRWHYECKENESGISFELDYVAQTGRTQWISRPSASRDAWYTRIRMYSSPATSAER